MSTVITHTKSPSAMLLVLHYATPFVVSSYFLLARIVASCFLHKPTQKAGYRSRRFPAIGLLFGTVVTLICQSVVEFIQSLSGPGVWETRSNTVYIFVSILVYGSLTLSLLENAHPLWHPYLGCFLIAAISETTIAVLQGLSGEPVDEFSFSRLALQVAKSLLLITLCISGSFYALYDQRHGDLQDWETEPLLVNGQHITAQSSGHDAVLDDEDFDDGSSGDIDSLADSPEQLREIKDARKNRLQQSGSWLNYMKDYNIFIPMIWPSRNMLVQGCLLMVLLVIIAERALNVLVPRQLGIVVQALSTGNGDGVLPWGPFVTWMVLSFLNSRAGISVIRDVCELPVEQFAFKGVSSGSFTHIMGLSMNFHNNKNSGELYRAIDHGKRLEDLLQFVILRAAPTFLDLIVAFIYITHLFDVDMAAILVFVGMVYLWIGTKTTVWSVKRRRKFNMASRNESKVLQEALSNWQTVSHFNRAKYECERYDESLDEYNEAAMSYYFAYYLGGGVQSLIMVIGRLAAMFLAVYRVSQGTATVGNFVTLTAYWISVEQPLEEISWSIRRLTQLLTDAERLLQLFKTKPTVSDAPDAANIIVKDGEVEFSHVEFAYDARKPTLKDISFKARPGQTIALVGETGGGKSTILKILYRYYDVSSGVIRIDGQDIRGVTLSSLRDSFGMVPQDPSLFNISIMENVRYAKLDATDEDVKEACRAAAIHEKIESFPDKYSSTVGERGVKLSGGELQRVAIARAILRQPKIILVDEATSMIDAETESLIQEAFKRLASSRTTFVIAHRLSTIQHADQILVIQDGEIIERGTHDELLRINGKYVALWSKQLSKEVQDISTALHHS